MLSTVGVCVVGVVGHVVTTVPCFAVAVVTGLCDARTAVVRRTVVVVRSAGGRVASPLLVGEERPRRRIL